MLSTNIIDNGCMNTKISRNNKKVITHENFGTFSQAYVRKKNTGNANVSVEMWLNVCAKNAGTKLANSAVKSDIGLCFVSV